MLHVQPVSAAYANSSPRPATHAVVQIPHDPKRPSGDQGYDEHAKRQRQHVVGVVRSGGDVQEEDQVNTHLRDGEHGEAERDAGRPEQRRVGDPERRGRGDDGKKQSDRVDEHAGRLPTSASVPPC